MNITHDTLERAIDHLERAQSILSAAQRGLTTVDKVHDSVQRTREFARLGTLVALGALAFVALALGITRQRHRRA